MTHDALGRPLAEGDIILVPMRIVSVSSGPDYCNVTAKSLRGRRPDAQKEFWTGNTAVVFRHDEGDHQLHADLVKED